MLLLVDTYLNARNCSQTWCTVTVGLKINDDDMYYPLL